VFIIAVVKIVWNVWRLFRRELKLTLGVVVLGKILVMFQFILAIIFQSIFLPSAKVVSIFGKGSNDFVRRCVRGISFFDNRRREKSRLIEKIKFKAMPTVDSMRGFRTKDHGLYRQSQNAFEV
jgi:hypothetical protein